MVIGHQVSKIFIVNNRFFTVELTVTYKVTESVKRKFIEHNLFVTNKYKTTKWIFLHLHIYLIELFLTRMATFIKAKLKKSDDQTNIGNYRVAANITEYHVISKLFSLRIMIPKFMMIIYDIM